MAFMEMVKSLKDNTKLKCHGCSKIFWVSNTQKVYCPECKDEWNGRFVKYIRVKIQYGVTNDWITVVVQRSTGCAELMTELLSTSALAFYLASGFAVEEISAEEFYKTDFDKVNKRTDAILAEMRKSIHDQSQREDYSTNG